ncbi:SPRY domain-containing SOCS box protein 4 [Arapaima gigas]
MHLALRSGSILVGCPEHCWEIARWSGRSKRSKSERRRDSGSTESVTAPHFPIPASVPRAAEPLPLMDLCRRAARIALGRDRLHRIESLPLPQSLKNYLQYQ